VRDAASEGVSGYPFTVITSTNGQMKVRILIYGA